MTLDDVFRIIQIILIDIALSGDNAVVIAMAARKLPLKQRNRAILWGGAIAILLRIIFTMIVAFLLLIPGVRLVGGLVLMSIACKLLLEEEEHEIAPDKVAKNTFAAIRTIFVADFVMSLDNMLAVAGASHGNGGLLLMGLLVSIAIIMTCSSLIAKLMNRYKWIVFVGAGILAFTAAEMMLGDREVAAFFVRDQHVVLDSHWKEWMFTKKNVEHLEGVDELAPELGERVIYTPGAKEGKKASLTFVGQMSATDRDELLARAKSEHDQHVIEELYEETRLRSLPGWVPEAVAPWAALWFQSKWPASYYEKSKGHQYPYAAWIFYAVIVVIALTSPLWSPKARKARREAALAASAESSPPPKA